MFSVTDLILDPFNAAVSAAADSAIVDYIDQDEASAATNLGKMHLEDISLGIVANYAGDQGDHRATGSLSLNFSRIDGEAAPRSNALSLNFEKYKTGLAAQRSVARIVGDFNGDGRDDLASIVAADSTIGPQGGDTTAVHGFLLPYMEQDNIYKISDLRDGTSNTIMFKVASIDVWEHAYVTEPRSTTNGIIAVLIGLSVDPSDPSGNTYAMANVAMAGESAPLVGTDISGTASLLASDEFFSQFANTTLDDQALVATTYGRGARASQFDRGYLSLGFYDLLVSSVHAGGDGDRVVASDDARSNHVQSILHEDNEFSFPRMITAGENVMAEWTSNRG